MKKREEILIEIEGCILPAPATKTYVTRNIAREIAKDIAFKLSDLGVVIKVECPDCSWSQFGEESVGMTPCYSCNSTGYIVEPIIEEK